MKTPKINSRILKLEVLKGTATRASVNAVESRTTSLESDVATAQGDISTLQGNVATLTQGIADAVSTHNTAPDAHADLRSNVEEVDANFVSISYNPSGTGGAGFSLDQFLLSLLPKAWFRADAGVLKSDGSAAASGDAVATWQDQSGNGYHLSQTDAARQPVYTSGILTTNVLRFDGSNDYLLLATFPSINLADCTVLAVLRQHSGSGADAGVLVIGASGTGEPYGSSTGMYLALGGTSELWVTGANTARAAVSGSGNTPWSCWSSRVFATSAAASMAGLVVGTGGCSVGSSLPGLLLGAYWLNGPTSFAAVDVAELLIFDRALADGAIGILASALRARWGI